MDNRKPIIMLAIYTLVFSQIFRARWGESLGTGHGYYAANLFTGLIIFNIFSECIAKAPTLISKSKSDQKGCIPYRSSRNCTSKRYYSKCLE